MNSRFGRVMRREEVVGTGSERGRRHHNEYNRFVNNYVGFDKTTAKKY